MSVGLPVFNGRSYLARAIDSLLAQDFADFELIISDNASTDGTAAICEAYAARDSRIRIYHNTVNVGAVPNHNRLPGLARGRYFRWAAHDDECAPTMIGRCVAAFEAAPTSVVLVYPQALLIDSNGNVIRRYNTSIECRDPSPHRRLATVVRSVRLGTPVYGLIRSEALHKTHLFGSFHSSDHVLLAELALLGEIIEVPEPLFFKRMHHERATQANDDIAAWDTWSNPTKMRRKGFLGRSDRVDLEYLRTVFSSRVARLEKLRCVWAVLWNSTTQRDRCRRILSRFGLFRENRRTVATIPDLR